VPDMTIHLFRFKNAMGVFRFLSLLRVQRAPDLLKEKVRVSSCILTLKE